MADENTTIDVSREAKIVNVSNTVASFGFVAGIGYGVYKNKRLWITFIIATCFGSLTFLATNIISREFIKK